MKTISYYNIDKSDWADGPWRTEPDKVQWQDPATGLPCLITRGHHGAHCGYVGITAEHPYYGKSPLGFDMGLSVHGDANFADGCQHSPHEGFGVCHIPEPGEPDNVWWIGFDCAHCYDRTPGSDATMKRLGIPDFMGGFLGSDSPIRQYRDHAYAKANVTHLAAQLHAIALHPTPQEQA